MKAQRTARQAGDHRPHACMAGLWCTLGLSPTPEH